MDSRFIMLIFKDGSSYIIPTEDRGLIYENVVATVDLKFFPLISGSAHAKRKADLRGRD